ncbi:conserved hypothetical protein [delta proteobacterium NaphS2]|nr:conserved hypothetical protein [delta proteobacterium NaphS2]
MRTFLSVRLSKKSARRKRIFHERNFVNWQPKLDQKSFFSLLIRGYGW